MTFWWVFGLVLLIAFWETWLQGRSAKPWKSHDIINQYMEGYPDEEAE